MEARLFSDFEKKLMENIIELDEAGSLNVLGNILEKHYGQSYIPDNCYVDIQSETDVSIQLLEKDAQNPDAIKNTNVYVPKMLLNTMLLFEYLDKENLVYFMGDLELNSIGMKIEDADIKYIKCDFFDDELKKLIYKYARKKIFVLESLRVLIQNNFKTDQEIRSKKKPFSKKLKPYFPWVALFFSVSVPLIIAYSVTSTIDIKNSPLITELNENSINKTSTAIKQGFTPIVDEIKGTQKELEKISNSINEAAKNKTVKNEVVDGQ